MQPNQPQGVINPKVKQLFKLDIRYADPKGELNKKVTAHELREILRTKLLQNDFEIIEMRFHVTKTNEIAKYEENIRNKSLPPQELMYNRIVGNPFIEEVFRELTVLKKGDGAGNEDFTALMMGNPKEDDMLKAIDAAIARLMGCYLNDKFPLPSKNEAALMEIPENSSEKVHISMIVLTHPNIFDNFKNSRQELRCAKGPITIYIDHPKGNKEIEKNEVSKLKISSSIKLWRMGTFDAEGKSFASYFDMKYLEEKLKKTNLSLSITSHILRDQGELVKKFDIYTDLFDKMAMKVEIRIAQIEYVTKTFKADERATVYYLKLKYPARYNIIQLDSNISQQKTFLHDWKRVENFPVLRNPDLADDQLVRLHLFSHSAVEITIQQKVNEQSQNFLEELFAKYNVKVEARNVSSQSMERILIKFSDASRKMKANFNFPKADKHTTWKLKYYILCLLCKGLIYAEEVDKIFTLIEENSNYNLFVNIFERMCNSGSKRLSYIQEKYKELVNWPEHLLRSTTEASGEAIYVFRVHITPSGYLYSNKSPQMRNRTLREYNKQVEYLMRCSILDDNGDPIKNSAYITRMIFRKLLNKIEVAGRLFIPLGWSPSQLRKFSLWYMHESEGFKRSQVLNFLGEFAMISPYAKMAARIGQSFSSSWSYIFKRPPDIVRIDDLRDPSGKLYTDGIGKISEDLIDDICLKLKVKDLSVVQIRYKGAKGLLALDPTLPPNTICLRPSMIKYECPHSNSDKYLDILSWNMYKGGFLNRQIIILLKTRGVPDQVFMSIQQRYINDIKQMSFRECTVFKELTDPEVDETLYNLEPANKIIKNLVASGFELDKEPFFKGILKILKRNGYQKLKEKSNINVNKAARIVGIIDEYRVLEDGEVYCRIFNPLDNKPPETVTSNVIIVRNPCLHPGDIRKQRCVSEAQIVERFQQKGLLLKKNAHPFSRFLNCVIFSQKAKRAVTCEISGSDLDGDNFFISWEEDLINIPEMEPHVITDAVSKPKEANPSKEISREEYNKMLDFFIEYMNYDRLGKIANSHLVRADQDGNSFANNPLCLELAIAHGNAVDFPKTGYCPEINGNLFVSEYPEFMEKHEHKQVKSKSVLGDLYRDIKERIENLIEKEEEEKEVHIELDEDLCMIKKDLDFKPSDIEEALRILYQFCQDLESILYLFDLTTEFEIYSGNITSSKTKIMKQSKPIEHIVSLKTRFINCFFNNLDYNFEKYFQTELVELKGNFFSEQIQQKALLWYVLSYTEFFEDLRYSNMVALNQFREITARIKSEKLSLKQGKMFIGLVWFTVPKVLMDIKIHAKKLKNPDQDKEEENEDGDQVMD